MLFKSKIKKASKMFDISKQKVYTEYMKKYPYNPAMSKNYKRRYLEKNRERIKVLSRASRKRHAVKIREYSKNYYALHKNQLAEYHKNYRKTHPQKTNNYLKKYNITFEEYSNILKKQRNRCLICLTPSTRRRLAVDHCHKTNKIRGLLCASCNLGLGYFKDSKQLLRFAYFYIKNFENSLRV